MIRSGNLTSWTLATAESEYEPGYRLVLDVDESTAADSPIPGPSLKKFSKQRSITLWNPLSNLSELWLLIVRPETAPHMTSVKRGLRHNAGYVRSVLGAQPYMEEIHHYFLHNLYGDCARHRISDPSLPTRVAVHGRNATKTMVLIPRISGV